MCLSHYTRILMEENHLKAVEDTFTVTQQNPAPGRVLQGVPITCNTDSCLAFRRFWIKPFRNKRKFQKASLFCLGPIKLLFPCIVFLLQLAEYFCTQRSVSSSLPIPPVWFCNLKLDIVGVFTVESDNFTNIELKCCCKNQTERGSGEKTVCYNWVR